MLDKVSLTCTTAASPLRGIVRALTNILDPCNNCTLFIQVISLIVTDLAPLTLRPQPRKPVLQGCHLVYVSLIECTFLGLTVLAHGLVLLGQGHLQRKSDKHAKAQLHRPLHLATDAGGLLLGECCQRADLGSHHSLGS